MRELTLTELTKIEAATGIHLPYVINEVIDYSALGVLLNMVVHGVTVATIGNGFLIGAGVGVSYALVRSVIYS